MDFVPFFKKLNEKDLFNDNLLKDSKMGIKPNGKPSWLTYLTAFVLIVGLFVTFTGIGDKIFKKGEGSALLAQTVSNNTDDIEKVVIDLDTLNGRIEKREEKFDKFLTQQTVKNALDSVKTEAIIEMLKEQKIFNGEVSKHIIREDN